MTLAKSPKHKLPKKGKHVKGLTTSELALPPAKLFEKRFKDMNDYFGWVESTKNTYSSRLANLLQYLPDIPFCYCLYDDYDRAVKAILLLAEIGLSSTRLHQLNCERWGKKLLKRRL